MPAPSTSNAPAEVSASESALNLGVNDLGHILREVQTAIARLQNQVNSASALLSDMVSIHGPSVADAAMSSDVADESFDDEHSVLSSHIELPPRESNANKWYCVVVGRKPGVFHGPSEVTPNINKVPGGHATKWRTKGEALDAFYDSLDKGLIERVHLAVIRKTLSNDDVSLYHLEA